MFARVSYTWQLMAASWSLLKRDKALVLFPLFSGIACILVIASFATPLYFVNMSDWIGSLGHSSLGHSSRPLTQQQEIVAGVYLFAFYFVNYFVITFFNVGIISCAACRIAGGEPTFNTGIQAALNRIHLIAGWALVSATVGLALKMLESHKKIGQIVAGLLGAAWTFATFLAVPVLVVENKGPIDAVKQSLVLLKKTWGTELIGNFSFGVIFFLLLLPGIAGLVFAFFLTSSVSGAAGFLMLALAVAYILSLALVQSALHSIFQAALYMYTQGVSDESGAFPANLMGNAMNGNG